MAAKAAVWPASRWQLQRQALPRKRGFGAMMAVMPLASGRSGKRKLSSTADPPLLVVINVQATVRLAPRNATVSPAVTLTYRVPGRSEIERVAVSIAAAVPYKSALAGGKGAHAEARPKAESASAIRKACLVVMMRPPVDLRQGLVIPPLATTRLPISPRTHAVCQKNCLATLRASPAMPPTPKRWLTHDLV